MPVDCLRIILRTATSTLHHQLDSAVGEFDNTSAYTDYVQKTHCFRLAVEQALANGTEGEWHVDAIADLAAQDLADLAEQVVG